jgi:hypothetical protein
MEIKSYLIEENEKLIYDTAELDAWQDQVQLLGLEKQAALMQPDKSPIPFPVMTDAEQAILASVLEMHEDYKNFEGEVIPLRVLSLIALCEKEKYFDRIQIWYSRKQKDPIVIGMVYDSEDSRQKKYSWNMLYHMIAEWGPKLKSIIELLPIWNEFELAKAKSNYDYAIKQHQEKYEQFKFQISSMQPAKKVRQ